MIYTCDTYNLRFTSAWHIGNHPLYSIVLGRPKLSQVEDKEGIASVTYDSNFCNFNSEAYHCFSIEDIPEATRADHQLYMAK